MNSNTDGKLNRSTPSITVYYQNVRGLRTKTNELFAALSVCDYDIVVLTETWLNKNVLDAELTDEYVIHRCDRSASTSQCLRGGGVLIGVKKNIRCNVFTINGADRLEQVVIRASVGSVSLVVCAVYLPPNTELGLYEQHAACINELHRKTSIHDRIVVLGDYNLPLLRWCFDNDVGCFIPTNASSEQEISLVENVIASGLQQVNYLTNENGRLLDLAFVNCMTICEIIEPPLPLMNVDRHHQPFVMVIEDQRTTLENENNSNVVYDFNHCDFDVLNVAISQINWREILNSGTLDEAVDSFYGGLDSIFRQHVPLKRQSRQHGSRRPWWNGELRNLRNRLRKARRRYFRLRNDDSKAVVRDLECQFNSLNASRFRSYISRLERNIKDDPKQFWTLIRNRTSTKAIPHTVNYLGDTSSTPLESASLFASFFQSVLSNNSPPLVESYLNRLQSFDLNLPATAFTERDVCIKLREVDGCKGPGLDGLLPYFIKQCSSSLAVPATLLFNRSLEESTFPSRWKEASITPIHKTGNVHDVTNYRAISILNCLPKVFESMVLDFLYPAVRNIIAVDQHGFMKKRSTTTNLMSYVSLLVDLIDKRQQIDAVYIDFSKAFDRVPHQLAIEKLKRIGFPDWLTKWFSSYLSKRSASVKLGTVKSDPFCISSGVPQGSHLGPLLFVLFVNDLCSELESLKSMYADDMKIFRVVSSPVDCCALQADVDKVLIWCERNGMEVNIQKCNIITFSRIRAPILFEYSMQSCTLKRVSTIKDLGITLDNKLRFNEHISSVIAKAYAVLGVIIRNTRDFNDIYCLKTLYISLVRSLLEYGVVVWSPYHAVQIDRIERVQKCFVRFALRRLPWRNRFRLPAYENRCALISLPTLATRRTYLQRLFVFDLLENNVDCPDILEKLRFNAPGRTIRRTDFFRRSAHRTQYGQHNPLDVCCQVFNDVYHMYDFNLCKSAFKSRISN